MGASSRDDATLLHASVSKFLKLALLESEAQKMEADRDSQVER